MVDFGSPFMSGYQYWLPEIRSFGIDYPFDERTQHDGSGVVADSLDGALLSWICPCPEDDPLVAFPGIHFYPLVLLGMFWIFTPPLATIPGLIEVWRRRRKPGPGFARLTVLTVLFYLVYFYVAARFMAGPADPAGGLQRCLHVALGRSGCAVRAVLSHGRHAVGRQCRAAAGWPEQSQAGLGAQPRCVAR